jgi:hypothetical protein
MCIRDRIIGGAGEQQWFEEMLQRFPQLAGISVQSLPDLSQIDKVVPWGWNVALRKTLLTNGMSPSILPDTGMLEQIRKFSHRGTAIMMMKFLLEDDELSRWLPAPAVLLSEKEVEDFASSFPAVVFKAPWSGSGKGLCWSSGPITENTLGWCRNIIAKQGCFVGEKVYDKVQDFAMEFSCERGSVIFKGYSLFRTERGVYKSNELAENEVIVKTLTGQGISEDVLWKVQKRIMLFLEKNIATFYVGPLGVDMFIFIESGESRLHPCVELNLRMTMGQVAGIFYDRFVQPGIAGSFHIDYFPAKGALLKDHLERQKRFPLIVMDGKIQSGYLSLSPVLADSRYRARVEIRE